MLPSGAATWGHSLCQRVEHFRPSGGLTFYRGLTPSSGLTPCSGLTYSSGLTPYSGLTHSSGLTF